MKKLLTLPLIAGLSMPALALPPMLEPGFNAKVNLGLSGGEIESNFLAEIDSVNVDLSDENIDSLDSPDSETLTMAVANFDVGYTLASGKTRFSLGNDFTDFIEFDRTTRLSVRHDFDTAGNVRVDALIPPSFATEVYRDPYQTGVNRDTTDMEVSGGRVTWDKIMGTALEFTASVKNIDIDDEDSGTARGLTSAERRLLDREGDVYRYELGYVFALNDQHSLRPVLGYVDRDLDGDAMSQDGVFVALRHSFKADNLMWVTEASYLDLDGDAENPIFDEVNDAEQVSFSSVILLPGAIDFLGKWTPNFGVRWADSDSDVDFNDSNIWMVSAALQRKF